MGRGAADQSTQAGASTRQRPFAEAWGDLRKRLNAGIAELRKLHGAAKAPEERQRLATKMSALEDALTVYEVLAEKIAAGSSDHAGAWRTFTDAMQRNYGLAAKAGDTAAASGFSVSLSYQRGYSKMVDAPPVLLPH